MGGSRHGEKYALMLAGATADDSRTRAAVPAGEQRVMVKHIHRAL
jgi:hypothetical protein